jgi:hypothetical protein
LGLLHKMSHHKYKYSIMQNLKIWNTYGPKHFGYGILKLHQREMIPPWGRTGRNRLWVMESLPGQVKKGGMTYPEG